MNPFEVFLTQPILNVLIIFYKGFEFVHLPWALGFAIITMTLVIRLALWPLTTAQLKSTQKMAALKPHLDRIKKEHGHDKVVHQQEVSKLYKEHGVNPLAGCLPLILQIPIFIALYNVLLKVVQFQSIDVVNTINQKLYFPLLNLTKIPDTSFMGVSLAAKPSQWQQIGVLILLVPIITGLLQFVQSKMLTQATAKAPKNESDQKDKKSDMEDTMASMQSQMVLIMPAMIAFFAYSFPVGLALYWNIFTIVGIIQQYVVSGAGTLNKYLPEKWQKQN